MALREGTKRPGLTAGDRQRPPLGAGPVLRQQDDLPDMVGEVGQVTIERLPDRERLLPDVTVRPGPPA